MYSENTCIGGKITGELEFSHLLLSKHEQKMKQNSVLIAKFNAQQNFNSSPLYRN